MFPSNSGTPPKKVVLPLRLISSSRCDNSESNADLLAAEFVSLRAWIVSSCILNKIDCTSDKLVSKVSTKDFPLAAFFDAVFMPRISAFSLTN